MIKIFAEIDDKKTRKNVREFLRSYRNIERLIGSVKVDFSAMVITKKRRKATVQDREMSELEKTRDSIIQYRRYFQIRELIIHERQTP